MSVPPLLAACFSVFCSGFLSITECQLTHVQESEVQQGTVVHRDRQGCGLTRGFPSEADPRLQQLPGSPQDSAHTCLGPAEEGGALSPVGVKENFWKGAVSAKTD